MVKICQESAALVQFLHPTSSHRTTFMTNSKYFNTWILYWCNSPSTECWGYYVCDGV